MKRFIRTESEIYDYYKECYYNESYIDELTITRDLGEIIRQADTIIELCDYVFLFDNEVTIRKITHENDKDTIEYLKECIKLGMKIKLAILTDNGLIYVAEMNNKGDLKLI